MIKKHWGLIAISAFALAACDVVRVPGDGREPPQPGPIVPDGAPGPPPPTVPVDDPWGEDDDDGADTNIPVTNPVSDPDAGGDADAGADTGNSGTDAQDDAPDVSDETPSGDTSDTEPEPPITSDGEPVTDDIDSTDIVPVDDDPLPVKFEYYAAGNLIPGTGFGQGDDTIYAPNMVFPIKSAPTFPQSMVYRLGGAVGGDQCDPENFSVPWRDNFCEKRSSNRNTPLCPSNKVHQGQDIRVGTAADCNAMRRQSAQERGLHEVVAVEDGIIQHIGTYSVKLKGTETGNIYSYLHLNMRRLRVSALDTVEAGDIIGVVSNDFGGTPTTYHLHFEMKAPIEGQGIVHVPPYMSLITAYERREGGLGQLVEDDTVEVASAPIIVDPSKLIE
jgi:murein DD-endopeptidase MepM/ murein hydrolase activator NlpD